MCTATWCVKSWRDATALISTPKHAKKLVGSPRVEYPIHHQDIPRVENPRSKFMRRAPQRPGLVTFVAIVVVIVGGLSIIGNLYSGATLAAAAMTEPAPVVKGQPPDGMAVHRFI